MKKKIYRILGVVLTLVLLSSFLIVSAPVGAATQKWGTFSTPGTSGLVLDPGNTWTGPFAMTSDGGAIYAGTSAGGAATALVKSTDGGRTWSKLSGLVPAFTGPSSAITDIVISSIDDNTIYVTDGYDIYKTSDGGTTWSPLSNLLTGGVGATGVINSFDVGFLGSSPYIFAATSTFNGAVGTTGGLYVAQEAVFGMPWSNMLIATDRPVPWATADVYKVLVDPASFATSQMVMAIMAADAVGGDTLENNGVFVTTKYGGAQWDATVNDVIVAAAGNSALWSASLWLPSDFNSSLLSGSMQAFVGLGSWTIAQGDVFLALFTAPATPPTASFDLNIGGAGSGTAVISLDGIGPAAGASLMASGYTVAAPGTPAIFNSLNGGAIWTLNAKRPTGGTSGFTGTALSSVLVLNSSEALVGTHGTDSGVSHSGDFGRVWNTISLINGTIATIDDLDFRADGTVFMATEMGSADSIWRNASSWERVFSETLLGTGFNPELVQSSPDGSTVFMADTDGPFNLFRSTDDGQTWTAQVSANPGGAIPSLLIIDANTALVGGAGVIYQTSNNGVIWFTRTAAIGTVQSLAVDPSSGDLMAGSASSGVGTIATSLNNGTSWSVDSKTIAAIDTTLIVTYGATDGAKYATGTDSGGDAGVWKRGSSSWSQIDKILGNAQSGTDDVKMGTGLVSGPGSSVDMIYAADGSAAGEGVYRIKANRSEGEQLADAGNTFMGLWYQPGSNILYTLAGAVVRTYTDTLNVAGSGVSVTGITSAGTATVSWSALTNATTYLVVVNTTAQTNFYTAVTGGPGGGEAVVVTNATRTAAVTGLTPGITYNVSVWSLAPVSSFLFNTDTIPVPPTAPIGPVSLVPANGAINIPILGPAFAWSPPTGVPGITGYNYELTTDPTFASITEGTAGPAAPYLVWGEALQYETAYYWRVRAVTPTGTSPWVTSVFTTVAESAPVVTVPPAPPAITPIITMPPVVVTVVPPPPAVITVIPPDIIVDIPPQEPPTIVFPEADTPTYIWAIIGIGAVLVIAVVVLIVRTRRVV